MPDFLQFLRQQNIFGQPPLIGNDLPSQGGITGNMPMSEFRPPIFPDPRLGSGVYQSDPNFDPNAAMQYIPPPQPGAVSNPIELFGSGKSPMDVNFGRGPLDINQYDIQYAGQPQPPMDAAARMRELYNPTNDATKRFENLVNQYPQHKDPSWLRRIASMIVDYSKGPEHGRALYEQPEREAIQDWKNQLVPAQQAANLERYENVNQRTLAYNQISAELREKAQQAKEKNDETNANIRQQRADIYWFKAHNPDMKIIIPKGGNVMAIDPRTGEAHDTGIPTGSLTEIDKLNLGQEQALERISATGAQTRATEQTKQTNRIGAIEARGEQTRQTQQTKGTSPTGVAKPMLPTQTRVDQFNRAREVMNTIPELAKWIKLGTPGSNDFKVTPPGEERWWGSSGPTKAQYDLINKIIYGSSQQAPTPAHTPTTPGTGTIKVKTKDGRTGTFKGTAEEATKAGFIVIGQTSGTPEVF